MLDEMSTPVPYRTARRTFLKALLYGMSLPGLWLIHSFRKNTRAMPELANPPLVVPYTPEPGVRFHDKAILVTTAEGLSIFSSACPHLGCRIDRLDGEELVCPCHGSRFNLRGEVVRNPAARSLTQLKYESDQKGAVLRIFAETT